MGILLFVLYWFIGGGMMIGACCVLGMAINTIIAILRIGIRPQNILLAGFYFLAGLIVLFLLWGTFFLAGWIGDRTGYTGQGGLLAGAVLAGIFAWRIIPGFIAVALKQTLGIEVSINED